MKNKKFITAFLLMFSMYYSKAQVLSSTYFIWNARGCDITVFYETSNCNGLTPGSSGTVVITPTTYFYPGCSIGDDILVTLLEIDYVDVTNGTGNGNGVTTPGGCFAGVNSMQVPINSNTVSTGCDPSGVFTLNNTGNYTKIGQ